MNTSSPTNFWHKLTPATSKVWLYTLAGLMWSGVGVFLCSLTIKWLAPLKFAPKAWFLLGGIVLALCIYRFGFSHLADKNIQRIKSIPKPKVCLFAFQQWTSYPLIAVMISLGIFLRHYSPIPKPWLALVYIGIGGSLLLASFHYYRKIWQDMKA
jgi:hypothetical protein